MRIRTAALTDIGKVREENEDRFLRDDQLRLYAVADGIGGLAGGGQAAEEAINQLSTLARQLPREASWDFQTLIATINERVAGLGQSIDATYGIGTTLTLVRILERQLQLVHVGDSSCHLLRGIQFEKLTHDHTVESEIKARHGRAAAAFLSPRTRNALTRCVGQPKTPEADVSTRALEVGDRILLSSDGITRFIQEDELAYLLARAPHPEDGLKEIIQLAGQRGGHDNATGVLLYIDAL